MIFPVAELKFCTIRRVDGGIFLTVRLYRVDDGGLDARGSQLYLRTLKRTRTFTVPSDWTKAQILSEAKDRLQTWAIEEGFNLPDDRRICTL